MNFRELKAWFGLQPFVTKYIVMFSVLIPLLLRLNPPLVYSLTFTSDIWRKAQLWRLVSHFFIAFPSIAYVMSLLLRARYSYQLETTMTTTDYAHFILFMVVMLNAVNIYTQLPRMWDGLSMSIVYVWSKQYSNAMVNFFGGVNIPGKYLPVVLILWDGLLQQHWMENIVGCLIAHVFWFGREEGWLRVPRWVNNLIEITQGTRRGGGGYKKIDSPTLRNDMPDQTTSQSRRVFSGKSYKLGE